jgi:hypothetical protein
MKLSVFHQTHGLSGHIRLGGQVLNFHFPKGEQEILVEVGVGGMTTFGKLRVAPRSIEHPADALDMVLTLVVPDAVGVPAVIGATKAPTVVAGPEGPKPVDSGNPETRSIANSSQGGALANRAVAQAMGETRVRVAPEPRPPYREQNASLDRDMGRPNATQRLMNDDQAVPSYERVASIESIVSHVETDPGDAVNVRERELIHRVKRTDPDVMPEAEVEPLDSAPVEASETYGHSDPTAVPELPEMRGFNEGPPENPDPNWRGGGGGGKKNRRR